VVKIPNKKEIMFDFRFLSLIFFISLHAKASAAFVEVAKYESQTVGVNTLYIDFKNIMKNKEGNIEVETIVDKDKKQAGNIKSSKNLIEIDCRSNRLAIKKSGSYKGYMGKGGFASDDFGLLVYQDSPFISWTSINDKSNQMLKDILKFSCNKK
jgi:hypothetical protein